MSQKIEVYTQGERIVYDVSFELIVTHPFQTSILLKPM